MSDFNRPIRDGYEFNGSEFVSEAWGLFKKEAGSFIGATILFLIIYIVVSIIPLVNFLATFVQGTLFAGYLIYAAKMKTGSHKMSDFFGGFKYFGQIGLYYLVVLLMFIPVFLIFFLTVFPFELLSELATGSITSSDFLTAYAGNVTGNIPMIIGIGLGFMVFALYITLSYSLTIPLIVNGNLGFWQAMETSRKTVAKNFFSFFSFYLVYGILALIIMIVTLFLGLLVIYPMMFLVSFVMYERIYQPDYQIADEIDAFGADSQDINSESQE